jgi:hypothetical protein
MNVYALTEKRKVASILLKIVNYRGPMITCGQVNKRIENKDMDL